MLSFGEGGRSVRGSTFAGAGSIFAFMPSPSATPSASSGWMFISRLRTRIRTFGVSTLLSSKVIALMMWCCSGGVWLMKNCRAWL